MHRARMLARASSQDWRELYKDKQAGFIMKLACFFMRNREVCWFVGMD